LEYLWICEGDRNCKPGVKAVLIGDWSKWEGFWISDNPGGGASAVVGMMSGC
jgi:hypothetical protein